MEKKKTVKVPQHLSLNNEFWKYNKSMKRQRKFPIKSQEREKYHATM